jgi:6-phosphogluconolactonase
MKQVVKYFSDLEVLGLEAARLIARAAKTCVAEEGLFTLVLSGGKTPARLYQILGQPPFSEEMPWPRVHFFWGDERCVPFDHPDSNFALAYRSLLSRISLPETNIHRPLVDKGPGPWAALEYEKEIMAFFGTRQGNFASSNNQDKNLIIPSFNLILLGVGRDGHTASLFPGNPALQEDRHLTAFIPASPLPPFLPRITLTLPLINQAQRVLFLAAGTDKAEVIRTILQGSEKDRSLLPAALVRPRGALWWFIQNGPK